MRPNVPRAEYCPKCHSADVVPTGFARRTRDIVEAFALIDMRCKACKREWTGAMKRLPVTEER